METCPRILWRLQLSLPEHHLTCPHNAQSLLHHDTPWPCVHVFHQTGREWMVLQVNVVFFEKVFRSLHEFQADTVGSILLNMLDDLSHEALLGFIGFDGDEDALAASYVYSGCGGSNSSCRRPHQSCVWAPHGSWHSPASITGHLCSQLPKDKQ